MERKPITVTVAVRAPLATVWEAWTSTEHIGRWAFASPEWGAEAIVNDVRVGGAFKTKMFAKDGSASFFFEGAYTVVEQPRKLAFELTDGRRVQVVFAEGPDGVTVTETFDPEDEHTEDEQRAGWQAFLENFRKHAESI